MGAGGYDGRLPRLKAGFSGGRGSLLASRGPPRSAGSLLKNLNASASPSGGRLPFPPLFETMRAAALRRPPPMFAANFFTNFLAGPIESPKD